MTKIEWADETWNPVTGCTPISEGCERCYAKRMANRLQGRFGYPEAPNHFSPVYHNDRLEQPLKWKKPRRVFIGSMGDLFHEDLRNVDIKQYPPSVFYWIMEMIRFAPQHTFMMLTKRPGEMADRLKSLSFQPYDQTEVDAFKGYYRDLLPLQNLWIGVSAENQKRADERIPVLLQIPAAVRFVSVEPILKETDLYHYLYPITNGPSSVRPGLDWVVIGCESGPGRRKTELKWIENAVMQCSDAGIPVFVKQAEIDGKLVKMPEILGRAWAQFPGGTK